MCARVCVYLVRSGGEAQAQLPADHHGFVDAPVLAAHRAPASGSAHIHQHLHATLAGLAASRQPYLKMRAFLTRLSAEFPPLASHSTFLCDVTKGVDTFFKFRVADSSAYLSFLGARF